MELAKLMFKLKNQLFPKNFDSFFCKCSCYSDNKFLLRERTFVTQ